MIGLTFHERDFALLGAASGRTLTDPSKVVEAVARGLCTPSSPAPSSARCVFARWKPGRALALAFEVAFDDGETRVVVAKTHVASKRESAPPYALESDSLRPWAFDELSGAFLSVFPHDRELPGLARALDLRRVARHVDELGLFAPLHVRSGPSRIETLRYKPERRAVLRLDLRLRERDDSPRVARRLIARVLPLEEGARAAQRRRAFDAAASNSIAPRLLGFEKRTGVLLEEHLDVTNTASGDFTYAREAGELLAQLHAIRPDDRSRTQPIPRADSSSQLAEWTHVAPWIASCSLPDLYPTNQSWRHGDLHPDQFARTPEGHWRLLDLDLLEVGDPAEDLASWIADEMACSTSEREWDQCGAQFLEAYRIAGGRPPSEHKLNAWTAHALARQAAGVVRRLERGAERRSKELMRRAEELVRRSRTTWTSAPKWSIERIDPAPGHVDGRLITEVAVGGDSEHPRVRWRLESGADCVELDPRDDGELALCARLREPFSLRARDLHLLAYRPRRRVTLRGVRADGSSSILKGYRRGRAAAAGLRACAVAQLASSLQGVRVPRVVALHGELHAVELEDLGGQPVDLSSLVPERFERFGAALRQFQERACVGELSRHGHGDELDVCRMHLERCRALDREPIGAAEFLERLERRVPSLPEPQWAACHRDLHDGQLLDLGDALGWIDFDLACMADSALDASNLIAHLALRRSRGRGPRDDAHEAALTAALERGLARRDDEQFQQRASFYRAASHLRLALVYSLRPQWHDTPLQQLELASEALKELAHA